MVSQCFSSALHWRKFGSIGICTFRKLPSALMTERLFGVHDAEGLATDGLQLPAQSIGCSLRLVGGDLATPVASGRRVGAEAHAASTSIVVRPGGLHWLCERRARQGSSYSDCQHCFAPHSVSPV